VSRTVDLATLLADASRVADVPLEDVPALLATLAAEQARAAALQTALAARIIQAPTAGTGAPDRDELLTVDAAAAMLSMSTQWLYRNARRLPFTRRMGTRAVRFSKQGIRQYLDKRPSVI
jgi:predicted DNA-binding transcriptional regulator AlpA